MHAACDSRDPDTIKRNVRGFERHENGGEGRLSLYMQRVIVKIQK